MQAIQAPPTSEELVRLPAAPEADELTVELALAERLFTPARPTPTSGPAGRYSSGLHVV